VNLSDKILSKNEIDILAKSLNFIPKPKLTDTGDVNDAVAQFERRIKLAYHFGKHPGNKRNLSTKFKEKSTWSPPEHTIHDKINMHLTNIENEIQNVDNNYGKSNISKSERKALNRLRKDNTIVIKPADKGSSTVIMSKTDYLTEAYRQLNNEHHYSQIPGPIHDDTLINNNNQLQLIANKGLLSKKQLEYLKAKADSRPRKFYMLPKIHKENVNGVETIKLHQDVQLFRIVVVTLIGLPNT